jgi:hypothetical protein
MIKKVLVAAIAAGALCVPLAGVASADRPADPGVGAGGVPGVIGEAPGGPGTTTPPGTLIHGGQEFARDNGFKNLPDFLRSFDPDGPPSSPGETISDFAHGILPGP